MMRVLQSTPTTTGATRLEILADKAMTSALMNTRAANETTPSCRVAKPKKVVFLGGQWQKGNEPNLTNRVKVAMEQVLVEEHGARRGLELLLDSDQCSGLCLQCSRASRCASRRPGRLT